MSKIATSNLLFSQNVPLCLSSQVHLKPDLPLKAVHMPLCWQGMDSQGSAMLTHRIYNAYGIQYIVPLLTNITQSQTLCSGLYSKH